MGMESLYLNEDMTVETTVKNTVTGNPVLGATVTMTVATITGTVVAGAESLSLDEVGGGLYRGTIPDSVTSTLTVGHRYTIDFDISSGASNAAPRLACIARRHEV